MIQGACFGAVVSLNSSRLLPPRLELIASSALLQVSNNVIGPAGDSYGEGRISDGISLACESSFVQNNEIVGAFSLSLLTSVELLLTTFPSTPRRDRRSYSDISSSWIGHIGQHYHCEQCEHRQEKESHASS